MNESATVPPDLPGAGPAPEAAPTVGLPPPHTPAEVGSVLAVSDKMVALTWLAFLIACFALYKLAWKPICQALDRREDKIRQSLKEAADIQANAAMDREAQRLAMEDAQREAAALIERARAAGEETGRAIEAQARAQAQALVRDAGAEIANAKERALADLRREAGDLALQVAGRVLDRKLDDAADRELTDRLIREIR